MKNRLKKEIDKSCTRSWLRSVCMLCAIAFVLVACVGCIAQDTAEEDEALKSDLTDAVEELDSVKADYAAAKQEIASLKGQNEAFRQALESLMDDCENAGEEVQTLKGEVQTLKDRDNAVQTELGQLKDSYDAAKAELESLKNADSAARAELEALKGTNDALQQEIESLKEQIREMQENAPTEEPIDKIKIYIDQGHNPTYAHNSGATGNGLYEENLTFEIGCLLATLLKEDGRFEVCLSRPNAATVLGTDQTTSLEARVAGAKAFGADYFISLHINSFTEEIAHGIEVLVPAENAVSYAFGDSLLQGLLQSTGMNDRGVKERSDLYVLRNATMPAALLEMGFISNAQDAKLLSEQPELFAQGIYNGILEWFHLSAENDSADGTF